jgi:uncharacterized NAD(P)/FAD-binding protein YdhS
MTSFGMERQSDCGIPSDCSIAVVGGGFCGSTLATLLLRHPNDSRSVVIIEKGGSVGRGLAYGTQCRSLLLNVPAGNMSAFVDLPLDFVRWAQLHYDPKSDAASFLPRDVYGCYLERILHATRESAGSSRLRVIQDEAVAITPVPSGAMEIKLSSGRRLRTPGIVLAQGNFLAHDPLSGWKVSNDVRYFRNPWLPDAFENVDSCKSVLLIGSGLTGIDAAIQLRDRGFIGTIHILSRRGLLPASHGPAKTSPCCWPESSPKTVRGLLRLVRQLVREEEGKGISWHGVVDGLRQSVPAIWHSLPDDERSRFLRHVRPYWEIHRHRAAPSIAKELENQLSLGNMKIHSGGIVCGRSTNAGIEVKYVSRKTGREIVLGVDRIINCTGLETDYRRLDNPLVRSLFANRCARPGPLNLGIDTSPHGALLDQDGRPSSSIYAVGSARKGHLWESTSVPELRVQVDNLARHLLDQEVGRL